MIPVHLDALFLAKSEAAAEPTADFRGLPFHDKEQGRDVNSDTPWIGDSVVTPPFENSNMTLQAGVHLHWSLPDGLCRGRVVDGEVEFPTVPNRWLVRRRVDGAKDACWVVESDYLWPPTDQAPAVNILRRRTDTEWMPYRFLGRKLTWEEWKDQSLPGSLDYLEKLTAIGHGEPTFAAYYPNCSTVFGFHDSPGDWAAIQYDLLGWYGGPASTLPRFSWERDGEDLSSFVEPVRRWRIEADRNPGQLPLLCYARIKLKNDESASATSSEDERDPKPKPKPKLKVAVGNTVTEALSATLATEVASELGDPDLAPIVEEQLEALHVESQLASEAQDIGLRLRRYRHQKSLVPVPGSERWTVHADPPGISRLSGDVLDALRDLNELQARHGQRLQELEHARRQLYGDWCNYMRCAYRPPDGGRAQFLDIDEVVAYIESRSLEKVERLAETVKVTGDRVESKKKALDGLLSRANVDAARQAEEAGRTRDNGTPERATRFTLRSVPGARYWEPADPVVLITGGTVRLSDRHGRDGRNAADGVLRCEMRDSAKSEPEDELRDGDLRDKVLGWLDSQWKDNPRGTDRNAVGCIGFREVNVRQRPWNPLFLDWGIDMHRAESRKPGTRGNYDRDVITDNYRLGAQSPDLEPNILWTHDEPDRFSGRCIFGSTSSVVLRERIEDVLQRRLLEGTPEASVNPDPEDPGFMTKWCEGLPGDLPKTPAELADLVKHYRSRPLRIGGAKPIELGQAQKSVQAGDPLYCTLLAYRKLFDNATDEASNENLRPRAFLGQALSGFNAELVQWKLGLALPIDEPIGLPPYRAFTERVAAAVGDVTARATEPTNRFSPIRSGALKLDKLRMIDSFGRVAEIPCDQHVIVPAPYQAPGRPGVAFLPPRLAQPARVTFRWLDAHPEEDGEMVEEAARSPTCGWLLPEKLSGRLLVFDGDGNPLGALAADRDTGTPEWVRAPGLPPLNAADRDGGRIWIERVGTRYFKSATHEAKAGSKELEDLGELGASIQNPRLARVLLYLWATRSTDFLERFLNTLDDAMANIDPEGATSMGSTALLVGRPVAVVGAELNLVLKDRPAVRQDWAAFVQDQYRHRRDTDGFPEVRFPLRLGQYKSRNDGVLGYWLDEPSGFVDDTFVAQAADDDDPSRALEISTKLHGSEPERRAAIAAHQLIEGRPDTLNVTQSVADPPLRTTVLMDPRGRAHVTTGILPVKTIDIPRPLWEPALEAIRVWFPAAPVLSRQGDRRVPTPTLVDRRWSWLEQESRGIWQALGPRPSVDREALHDALGELQDRIHGTESDAIDQLIAKGWLEEREPPGSRLNLGPREDRLALDDRSLEAPLDHLLAQLSLALVSPGDEADFDSRVEVREGWLLLEPGTGAHTK